MVQQAGFPGYPGAQGQQFAQPQQQFQAPQFQAPQFQVAQGPPAGYPPMPGQIPGQVQGQIPGYPGGMPGFQPVMAQAQIAPKMRLQKAAAEFKMFTGGALTLLTHNGTYVARKFGPITKSPPGKDDKGNPKKNWTVTTTIQLVQPVEITVEWLLSCGFKAEDEDRRRGYTDQTLAQAVVAAIQTRQAANAGETMSRTSAYEGTHKRKGKDVENAQQVLEVFTAMGASEAEVQSLGGFGDVDPDVWLENMMTEVARTRPGGGLILIHADARQLPMREGKPGPWGSDLNWSNIELVRSAFSRGVLHSDLQAGAHEQRHGTPPPAAQAAAQALNSQAAVQQAPAVQPPAFTTPPQPAFTQPGFGQQQSQQAPAYAQPQQAPAYAQMQTPIGTVATGGVNPGVGAPINTLPPGLPPGFANGVGQGAVPNTVRGAM